MIIQQKERIHFTFKRKTAKSNCIVSKGSGLVVINGLNPLQLSTGDSFVLSEFIEKYPTSNYDFCIRTEGGGVKSVLEVSLKVLAKAMLELRLYPKTKLLEWNRSLLSSDGRNVEPKSAEGQGARAKRQKSYR